jgi:ParB-like chromosome segregation protein Spo0J
VSEHQPTAAAEMVDPSTLRPWPQNPRKNDGEPVDRVAASIQRFGFAAPIVARLETREIIAGHTRWKAAIKLKLLEVPVRFLDLDEREARLLALADNRLGELADWNVPDLVSVLEAYDASEVLVAGWDDADLASLAPDEPAPEKPPKKEENHCPHCGRYMSAKLMAAHAKREARK